MINKKTFHKEILVAGRPLILDINKVAPQANASVIARYGDTTVMVTVSMGAEKPMSDGGAPVTVDFVERLYAGGIIKGSRWVKREGRPTDDATLTGRMIDRSVRPLFPKDLVNEVQIVVTLLSTDNINNHDVLALNAVSTALAVSNIPWKGPVSAVRVGSINGGEPVINPSNEEMDKSEMDLVVSANAEGILMIEAGAKQVPEEKFGEGVEAAFAECQKVVAEIEKLVEEVGQKKYPYNPKSLNKELLAEVEKKYREEIAQFVALESPETKMDGPRIEEYKKALSEKYVENPDRGQIPQIVDAIFKKILREGILKSKKRIDGRKATDIRNISAEVGLLPRTHGSALFQRGLTQVMSVVTLANPRLEQWIETAEGMEEKKYIHHYSAPPYSTGEVGRMGGLGRREVGHGALAERALLPVIPGNDVFPYTIRVVSEVLSQNGSSSMGSTCGSTLALMDAGVPLLAPVSGVAMGLVAESQDEYVILSDLRGEEDFYGNMDFKVTGTTTGITAIQLDIKLNDGFHGLSVKMVKEILAQAKEGRAHILEKMLAVLSESRKQVSQYAPKVVTVKVPTEKIGEIIGPGGKNIRNIIATTKAAVDVDDDGVVTISAVDGEAVAKAKNWIEGMVREVQVGEEFEGEVKRILPFGAFVEFLPGKEGLVHVSKMSSGFVANPEDVVKIGDKVKVKVVEIDDMGRLNLSMNWMNPPTEGVMPNSPDGENGGGFRPMGDRGGFRPRFGGRRPGGPMNRSRGFGGGSSFGGGGYRGGRRDR